MDLEDVASSSNTPKIKDREPVLIAVTNKYDCFLVKGAEDWHSVDLLDGCDLGFVAKVPEEAGVYKAVLCFRASRDYEGDYDIYFWLENIEEVIIE